MRQSIVILGLVLLSGAFCSIAVGQVSIKSVTIKIENLETTKYFSHTYAHGQLSDHGFDTTIISVLIQQNPDSVAINKDNSISLFFKNYPPVEKYSLVLVLDTVKHMFTQFTYYFHQMYGGDGHPDLLEHLSLTNVAYINTANGYELNVSDMPDSTFLYEKSSYYDGFGGSGEDRIKSLHGLGGGKCSVSIVGFLGQTTVDKNTLTNEILLNPNPVVSTLNIHLQNPDSNKLIITDLLGREVLNRSIGEGEEDISLNVASLLKGVYWVRIGSRVQKFIVQH